MWSVGGVLIGRVGKKGEFIVSHITVILTLVLYRVCKRRHINF